MNEAIEALIDPDPDRRDNAAGALGDLLRTGGLDQDSARAAVARLVVLAVEEPVTRIRESALNAVSEAFNSYRLPLTLVEPLTTALDTMPAELLAHAVYIFGATQDPRARPLIEPFLSHPDSNVCDEAEHALMEIPATGSKHNS
jgi:HEAT repeat protein